MAPDVSYYLTEDQYNCYGSLLAAQGVKVLPQTRETIECLGTPTDSMLSVHGLVIHEDKEFRFIIQCSNLSHRLGHRFDLYAFESGVAEGEAVMAAVERAFPQPKRGGLQQPRPERKWDARRVFSAMGCLGVIVLFGAVCFFVVVGIRHFFR